MKYKFTLIGGGHVLTKYLLPIQSDKFEISRIISKANKIDFFDNIYSNQDYPKYRHLDLTKIEYQKTNGNAEDIIEKIKQREIQNEVILILTPPQTHFEILKAIVKKTNKKVYVEKPAVTKLENYQNLLQLYKKNKNRVYLAEQYVYGRTPIFEKTYEKYKNQIGKIKAANLYIEEGGGYFDLTSPWFPKVGPELDLGVHLLGFLFKIIEISKYKINYARKPKNYLINYGSETELELTLQNGQRVQVFLKCGKHTGETKRYLKLIGEKGNLWQKYPSETAEDPVFIKLNGKSKQCIKNAKDYQYFNTQIDNFIAWMEKPKSQDFILQALECALKIKEERLKEQQLFKKRKLRYVAMIPARMDSKRMKNKSVREMAGKPMVYYAIKAAIEANIFDEIYVNSESEAIGIIGLNMGVNFYKRSKKLAQDNVGHEEFVYDFLKKVKADYIFMIHANKPLIKPEEIRKFVKKMIKQQADSMFSVNNINTQVFVNNNPVNFEINNPYLRSGKIKPAQVLQWTITGWKVNTFLKSYQKNKNATFSGKVKLFPVSKDSALNVEKEKDFILAEQIMKLDLVSDKKDLQDLISQYRNKFSEVLASLDLENVRKTIGLLVKIHKHGGRIFVMGNGGSAATASHFAADLSQNVTKKRKGRINVTCLNDNIPKITAIANDLGFEKIFVEQLCDVLQKDDLIIVITGSGNSPNIVEAIKYAKNIKAKSIGMLGFDGGKSAKLVDASIMVKSNDYTVIENIHMFICDLITNYFQKILRTSNGAVKQ